MAYDPIAQARIEIELNDDAVVAGLQRVDREYAKTMRDIDRQRAEAKVTLDTSKYDDAIKNIRREMKELDGRRATGDADLDTKTFDRKMKKLRKELRDVEGQKATVELELKGEEGVKKAQERIRKANEKMVEAIERREQQRQREYEKAEARRLAGVRNEARVSASLNRQRERELASAHSFALKLNREMDRAAENRQRDLQSIPRLQREYAELTTKIEQLGSARRKAFGDKRAQVMIDLHIAETEAKMRALVGELERIGSDVDVRINFKSGRELGDSVRQGFKSGGVLEASYQLGRGMGMGMLRGIRNTFSPRNLQARGLGALQKVGNILDSISEAAVRIGPFTATIRSLLVVMSVLGPTIVDLAGALGSLVGVMGTGLVGASALAAGGISAFAVALGGVGMLLPTLFRDFKNLTTLQDAYHKQVLKTGANSDKAKTKLEEFNHALGEVQPTTREAFLNLDRLRDRWNKMAQDVKPQFFDAMGASLLTVNKHFSWFSDNTRRTFTILTKSWDGWMTALRGDEATTILHTLGSNGRRALGPLLDAFGNLVTWFGRIAASASNYLPGLMRQFRDWSQSAADSVGPTTNLGDKMERLVDHTRALGRFLASGTKLLVTFFNGGADSGEDFLGTMTAAMDRWTEFLRSADGQNKLRRFFDQSVKGAQALYSVLAPLVSTFVVWAQKMSPIVTGFLEGAGAVASFVTSIVKLLGLQNSVGAMATTLGAFWAVGKIQSATLALTGFSRALLGLGGAQAAASATAGAGGAGGILGRILGGSSGRIIGPAEKTFGNTLKAATMGGLKFAGLIGVGVMAMQLIGKGMGTLKAREGVNSSILGLSRDVLSTFSFGIADSAEESSRKAAAAIGGALRRNMNLELNKNIKLGGKGLNGVTTLDLTVDQKKMARNFQMALQAADRIAKNHHLPELTQTVRVNSNPQDFKTIENNWARMENNLATSNATLRRNTDETLAAMKRSMDLRSREGQMAVEKNFGLVVTSIKKNMDGGGTSVHDGMLEIRRQFRIHSQASAHSADVNFGAAKSAIKMAVKDGVISSQKGLSEIRKLWVSYLKLYGFSEKEATNMSKGNRYDGGPEEGTRGPTARAGGGLVNVGQKGKSGRDNVPAMLNGQPSVIAEGEQVAVFNRHQQKAMDRQLPGGLEGFFGAHQRKHYMASGGIVGEPARYAGGGIAGMIGAANRVEHAHFPYVWGGGHGSSPAPFVPFDCSGAVSYVLQQGGVNVPTSTSGSLMSMGQPGPGAVTVYANPEHTLMSINGRFFGTSTTNPGGGAGWIDPAPSADYLSRFTVRHFGPGDANGLGGVMPSIKTPSADAPGLVGTMAQRVLDVAASAANQSLQTVMGSMDGGGNSQNPAGAGALSRAEMVRYAKQALSATANLGHGGPTAANVEKILTLAMKESGWDPGAQNMTDINAQQGNRSVGLMQVTLDKVNNNLQAGLDPLTNMIASIKYQMSRYHRLITFSPYAAGGIVPGVDTMSQSQWAKGGMVERPTLMTGEDGRKSPEFVVGTNPMYRKTNIQALTNAAQALGVPMARKSKTGTIKPSFVNGTGRDPENLKEVKDYAKIQGREDDKRREISIAESKVKEPDTLIKQQGTDALGNPLYVVDQSKIDAYVGMMTAVKNLYDDLINKIMVQLMQQAQRAYSALDRYRGERTQNIAQLDSQNAINKRLMRSKDKHTAEAAERRYNAGIEMRGQQVGLRNDAEGVRTRIREDQKDAQYRVQEYGVSRQSVIDDIAAVGSKAAADAASETKSAYQEPDTSKPDLPPTPGQMATDKLETEYALAQAGYGMNGQLGSQRDIKAIIGDLIKANELRITEAQAMLNDADATNDQDAYSALTQAANAIKGLKDELAQSVPNMALENSNLGSAMMDLYRSMGGNFSLAQSGLSAGNQVASAMGKPASAAFQTPGVVGGSNGVNINIEQNFPQQPDPVTWAAATNYELNAAL